jgi:hypothetical protein
MTTRTPATTRATSAASDSPKRYARPEFGFQYPEEAEIGLARRWCPP